MTMKQLLTICLLLLSASAVSAQVQPGFHYVLPVGTVLSYKPTPTSPAITVTTVTSLKASIEQEKDTLTVHFWRFVAPFPPTVIPTNVNQTQNPYGFTIPITPRAQLSDPLGSQTIRFATTEIGPVTIPFKYRLGLKQGSSSEFSSDFNAGIYIGRKWGSTRFSEYKEGTKNRFTFTLAGFLGPTAVGLTADNTSGPNAVTKDKSVAGFSIGAGGLFAFRAFGIGIVSGTDVPLNTHDRSRWNSSGDWWLGFGISYKATIFAGE